MHMHTTTCVYLHVNWPGPLYQALTPALLNPLHQLWPRCWRAHGNWQPTRRSASECEGVHQEMCEGEGRSGQYQTGQHLGRHGTHVCVVYVSVCVCVCVCVHVCVRVSECVRV